MTNETPFSKNAEMYRDEKVFAEGEDLGLMIKTAECRAEHRVLDIGAGSRPYGAGIFSLCTGVHRC